MLSVAQIGGDSSFWQYKFVRIFARVPWKEDVKGQRVIARTEHVFLAFEKNCVKLA